MLRQWNWDMGKERKGVEEARRLQLVHPTWPQIASSTQAANRAHTGMAIRTGTYHLELAGSCHTGDEGGMQDAHQQLRYYP